jgi:hypothetical protein
VKGSDFLAHWFPVDITSVPAPKRLYQIMSNPSCTSFPDNCGELKHNADIAGRGVTFYQNALVTSLADLQQVYVSFMTSAAITVIAAMVKFLTRWRTKHPDHMVEEWRDKLTGLGLSYTQWRSQSLRGKLNLLIEHKQIFICKEPYRIVLYQTKRSIAEALDRSLQALIVGLADQQAIVTIAILMTGQHQLDHRAISAYHFNIIVFLAWFSCFAHAVTLMCLVNWMMESGFLLGLRLFLFLCATSLTFILQHSARDYQHTQEGRKAACFADCCAHGDDVNPGWKIMYARRVSLALMALLVAWRVLIVGARKIQWTKGLKHMEPLRGRVPWALAVPAVICAIILTGLDVGKIRQVSSYPGLEASDSFFDQNDWSFGQIVPMILLLLPLLGAVEGFVGELIARGLSPYLAKMTETFGHR